MGVVRSSVLFCYRCRIWAVSRESMSNGVAEPTFGLACCASWQPDASCLSAAPGRRFLVEEAVSAPLAPDRRPADHEPVDVAAADAEAVEQATADGKQRDLARLAPHPRRLGAFLVDVSAVALVFGVEVLLGQIAGLDPTRFMLLTSAVVLGVIFALVQGLLVWLTGGQTIGKALFGLTERRAVGTRPTATLRELAWAVGRHSWGYLVIDVLGVGVLAALVSRRRRCLHDLAFGTEVVYVGWDDAAQVGWEARGRAFVDDLKAGLERSRERFGWAFFLFAWLTKIVVVLATMAFAIARWFKPAAAVGQVSTPQVTHLPAAAHLSPKAVAALWTSTTVATVVIVVPVLPGPGPTSTWQAVALSSQVAPGVARSPDGVLHLVFRDPEAHRLLHVSVKDGRPRPPDVVADGWGGLNSTTALVATRDGSLQAFFGGTPPHSFAADFTGIKTTTSHDGGRTWSAYQQTGAHFYAFQWPVGTATLGKDGRAILAWPGFGGLWFGQGHELGVANGCCVDSVAVVPARDGVVIAYSGSPPGVQPAGLFVRTARPTAFTSPPTQPPNSGSGVFALTDRPGRDGQFLAYLGNKGEVYLWRIGGTAPLTLGTGAADAPVAATADNKGRVWVVWSAVDGLHAARTNAAVTRVDAQVTMTLPAQPPAQGSSALSASAKGDDVDIVWSASRVWVRHLSG